MSDDEEIARALFSRLDELRGRGLDDSPLADAVREKLAEAEIRIATRRLEAVRAFNDEQDELAALVIDQLRAGPRITVARIMALSPCAEWPESRVRETLGAESVTVPRLVELLGEIDPPDARWLVSGLLSRTDRVRWAADCAERVVGEAELVAQTAIAKARAWADNPCEETQLAAFVARAYAAPHIYPVYSAVYSAAASVASAAATGSASHAVSAVSTAVYAVANASGFVGTDADAEHRWQLERAGHYLLNE